MSLMCWSLTWTSLSEAQRGRVATPYADVSEHLVALRTSGVEALVLVSTCQRLDIYAWVQHIPTAARHFTRWCAQRAGLGEHLNYQVYRHEMAARYLFRCAAGLQSIVLGEVEILGQLHRAWHLAQSQGYSHSRLNALFSQALATGRKARAQTGICRGSQRLESLSLETAAKHCQQDMTQLRWLVVGTGQMGQSVLRQLSARQVTQVRVINRTPQPNLVVEPWGHLTEALRWADAVVVCTGASQAILHLELLTAKRPQVILDLALPANVDPEVAELSDVAYWDLTMLQERLASQQAAKRQLLPALSQVLNQGWKRYLQWCETQQWEPFLKWVYTTARKAPHHTHAHALRKRLHPLVCALKQATTPRMQAHYQAEIIALLGKSGDTGNITAHGEAVNVVRSLVGVHGL